MDDEIIKLLAQSYFGREEPADWAIKCLEKGYDSKSLRMLASISKWESSSVAGDYFQRTLKELGWDKISQTDYLMKYAKILAQETIENKIDPIQASKDIYQILIELVYPAELHGWFEIDEMIWDYEHFVKTGVKYYHYHSKEKLIDEIKRVSEELIKSKEKFR